MTHFVQRPLPLPGRAITVDFDDIVWSRVKSGSNSLSLDDLVNLMVACGNDAPLIWLLIKRGYDPHSLRPSECEADRRIREANERADKLIAEANEKAARANMRADIAMELARKAAA